MLLLRCKELIIIQVNFMKKEYLPILLKKALWQKRAEISEKWFKSLKSSICKDFLKLENIYNEKKGLKKTSFKKKNGLKMIVKILVEE